MAKRKAVKPRTGDIFEVPTEAGLAYVQYTHEHPDQGTLIRVLPGIFPKRTDDVCALAERDSVFVSFCPIDIGVEQGWVPVGNCPVPKSARPFPLFRYGITSPVPGKVGVWKVAVWKLWDGDKLERIGDLTPEQRKLPIYGIFAPSMIAERIAAGWTPERDTW
jgi:hypothetical protein